MRGPCVSPDNCEWKPAPPPAATVSRLTLARCEFCSRQPTGDMAVCPFLSLLYTTVKLAQCRRATVFSLNNKKTFPSPVHHSMPPLCTCLLLYSASLGMPHVSLSKPVPDVPSPMGSSQSQVSSTIQHIANRIQCNPNIIQERYL